MITIENPQKTIQKVLGKQTVNRNCQYRLMKYVYQVQLDDKTVLHNMVTGQLVILEPEECKLLSLLPAHYTAHMDSLIEYRFLIPEGYDELRQVQNLRRILRMLDVKKSKYITSYTILPTTACNARCYYCFESGVKTETMSEKTADDVIAYISDHCGDTRHVYLSWFGGEPTVAVNRITQICRGLTGKGISISSEITTNAYLLDEDMISTAKEIWHLRTVKISVDGTEANYNKVKNYVNGSKNPYKVLMNNIKFLLNSGIYVNMRMNIDLKNYQDFSNLIYDLTDTVTDLSKLSLKVHPVIGEHIDYDGEVKHGESEWFTEKIVELNDISRKAGLYGRTYYLPFLNYKGCQASSSSSVTITPNGNLVRCPEQFGSDQIIGNIYTGIRDINLINSWKIFADYEKCKECFFYPRCSRLINCGTKDRCEYKKEINRQTELAILERIREVY